MRATLLQPLYFPWIGMFDMMAQCDLFIFYDDAQYVKQVWQSRNRIKTPNGVKWISVSVDRDYHLGAPIREIEVNHRANWVERNLNQIKEAYRGAPYFDTYFPLVRDFLQNPSDRLVDFTSGSVRLMADLLNIDTMLAYSSEFGIAHCRGPQKVVEICLAAGADEYLDGASGRELYDPGFFTAQGVAIHFHEYQHPEYRQMHGDFIPYLSIIDLIFNEGPNSLAVIRSGNRNKFPN